MGNQISTFCNCSENQKQTEHTINDAVGKSEKFRSEMSEELQKKTRARGSIGFSDAETSDFMIDSLRYEIATSMLMNNGFVYDGQLLNGKKFGKGTIKNIQGKMVYEGNFKDDLYEGEGILILDNGLVYSGLFKQGKRHGKGLLFSNEDKYRYEGEWKDDFKYGKGTETYPDGSSYVGDFSNNKKNGKGLFNFFNLGIYYMNDGSVYEGSFRDDRIEGEGKFTWAPDKIYTGEWKNNSLNGFGIFIKSGKIYIGNFVNDSKQGLGLYILQNGNILVGSFEKGEIEGLTIIMPMQGTQQICFMAKSKPQVLISDENEKNNIKLSVEYKNLISYYESNKELVDDFIKDKM